MFFAMQGYAAPSQCADFSGEYSCQPPTGGDNINLTIRQTTNSDNFPVITMDVSNKNTAKLTFEYILDKQFRSGHIAICQEDSFQIIVPRQENLFQITNHHLNLKGEIQVVHSMASIEYDDQGKGKFQLIKNMGAMLCTITK